MEAFHDSYKGKPRLPTVTQFAVTLQPLELRNVSINTKVLSLVGQPKKFTLSLTDSPASCLCSANWLLLHFGLLWDQILQCDQAAHKVVLKLS